MLKENVKKQCLKRGFGSVVIVADFKPHGYGRSRKRRQKKKDKAQLFTVLDVTKIIRSYINTKCLSPFPVDPQK